MSVTLFPMFMRRPTVHSSDPLSLIPQRLMVTESTRSFCTDEIQNAFIQNRLKQQWHVSFFPLTLKSNQALIS